MPAGRRLARFNRSFANRVVGPFFLRLPGYGAVDHTGRKSGRQYRTPVKLFRHGDDYVITRPYGAGCDWVKNGLAAGSCELVTRGERIAVTDPRLFADDGRVRVPGLVRSLLKRMNSTEFLALSPARSPAASAHRAADA